MNKIFGVVAVALMLAVFTTQANASDKRGTRNGEDAKVTIHEAIGIAEKEVKGRVIEVEYERGTYEVKIRTKDGSLRKLYIDAEDGHIKKVKKYRDRKDRDRLDRDDRSDDDNDNDNDDDDDDNDKNDKDDDDDKSNDKDDRK